jgi:hypothetical protein
MKIKIGNIEIDQISMDELDEIVKRYGNFDSASVNGGAEPRLRQNDRQVLPNAQVSDRVLLQKLVEGEGAITANEIATILGKRGRATRSAAKQWAQRVGLTTDCNIEPFDDCRVGTQRGVRLKPSLLDVAKAIHNGH